MTRATPDAHAAHPPRPARPPVPRIVGTRDGSALREGELVRLSEMEGVALAAGTPDIRGWTVRSSEGRAIGRVEELLVDAGRMRVRYLAVALEDEQVRADGNRRLLTPANTARLDDERREVLLARSVADIADVAHRGQARAPGGR